MCRTTTSTNHFSLEHDQLARINTTAGKDQLCKDRLYQTLLNSGDHGKISNLVQQFVAHSMYISCRQPQCKCPCTDQSHEMSSAGHSHDSSAARLMCMFSCWKTGCHLHQPLLRLHRCRQHVNHKFFWWHVQLIHITTSTLCGIEMWKFIIIPKNIKPNVKNLWFAFNKVKQTCKKIILHNTQHFTLSIW